VAITDRLLPFLERRDVGRILNWHGNPIASVKKGFKTAVEAAGLSDEKTPYSLRHKMELRRRGVPTWEFSGLLGHRIPGVTEVYAQFDPNTSRKAGGNRRISR
jgi:integrase